MANLDKSWIGVDINQLMSERTGRECHVVNDADAAGLAEARFGAARGVQGLVIATTLGTGIGSALMRRGMPRIRRAPAKTFHGRNGASA